MRESKIASANAANKTAGWQPIKNTAVLLFSNGLIKYCDKKLERMQFCIDRTQSNLK